MSAVHERADLTTLLLFATSVVIGGANFVGVSASNEELAPFWGAALRFGGAGLLLLALTGLQRLPLPRGRALAGAAIYGVLAFTATYALLYWGLLTLPVGLAATIMASGPLWTQVFARLHGQEQLHSRGVFGGLLAIAGIAVMSNAPVNVAVPLAAVLAVAAGAACAAEATVVVKGFPRSHPVTTNAVAMAVGSPLLLLLSLGTGEPWALPQTAIGWSAIGYLIIIGSVGFFILILAVLKRWTASATSYLFVIMPIVAGALGAWIFDDPVTPQLVLGAAIVLLGVYVGALLPAPTPAVEGESLTASGGTRGHT